MSNPLPTLIARNRATTVEYCADRDVMHVTIGPVTLRLTAKATHLLCTALVEALERLPVAQRAAMSFVPTRSNELSS